MTRTRVEPRLPRAVQETAAAIREEQRAGWELGDAIHKLGEAVRTHSKVNEALAAVARAEAKVAALTALRTRLYQEILNTARSEVR